MGTLYYGDNLDFLRRYVADASVNLVYLDPPFNSAQDYNAFFEEKDGKMPHTLIAGADGLKYQTYELTGAGRTATGETGKPWRGFSPGGMGRHWGNSHATVDEWAALGLIHFPANGGFPRRRGEHPFVAEDRVVTVGDVWTDIDRINQAAKERLGYPTQKPVALLERIIAASSNHGDTVLDPFCGCGTTVDAAQKLGRAWIGIDITHLAITLIKGRLRDTYGSELQMKVLGEPTDLAGARQLAAENKYQFQWWALGLVGARPVEQKKGADGGVDGKILFRDHPDPKQKPQSIIFSVKGGGVGVKDVRDLDSVVTTIGAAIGVLLTIEEPTKPMREWAANTGSYVSGFNGQKYPRLQLRTIDQLLAGVTIERPSGNVAVDETFKKAQQARAKVQEQPRLGL